MMMRSLSHLWIFLITIQQFLHYGQTQIIKKMPSDPLGIDEAFLTISNKNYSDSILFMYNVVVCEHCDFDRLADHLRKNTSETLTISTRYPYDFQLFNGIQNRTIQCQIQSYRFSEHGSYVFEVIQVNQNQSSCTINQTKESSYYWLPIILLIIFLCVLVFVIQLFHHVYNSRYVRRILTNADNQRLINNESDITPQTSPITNRRGPAIIDDQNPNDDIHTVGNSTSELPLVGSTRLSDNSVTIMKVLPKRLRSLDTFRGFSLMVMIFVNYGGKNISLIHFPSHLLQSIYI